MQSDEFALSLNKNAAEAWHALKEIIRKVLGRTRVPNYRDLVCGMLEAFARIGVNMSLKVHLMHCHLDYFERQLATESDEQGERFRQVTIPMEIRYRGKKLDSMIADICWWLKVAKEDIEESDDPEDSNSSEFIGSDEEDFGESDEAMGQGNKSYDFLSDEEGNF